MHLQANFPVAGVVTQRHRAAVPGANPTLSADNQHLFAGEFVGVPAHAGVLRHPEQIAARRLHQHLRRQRQRALRAGSMGDDRIKRIILGRENRLYCHLNFPVQQSLSCCSSVLSCRFFASSSGEDGGSTCVEIGRPHSTIASLITFTNGVSSWYSCGICSSV